MIILIVLSLVLVAQVDCSDEIVSYNKTEISESKSISILKFLNICKFVFARLDSEDTAL